METKFSSVIFVVEIRNKKDEELDDENERNFFSRS